MVRIAVLDDYIGCAQDFGAWSSLADDHEVVFFREAIAPERLVETIVDFEVLVITQQRTWFPREVLERLPKLRLIVTNASTSNAVDHECRRELGILLCGTSEPGHRGGPSGSTEAARLGLLSPPAELAWALLFAATKRLGIEDREIRAGGWQTGFPMPLSGRTLGLAGLGNLGAMMCAPARAFNMEVIAWSEHLSEERAAACGARLVTKDELLRESDVLGIFLRLSERTRGLFGAPEFAQMRRGAVLVNVSRGPIVDEGALIDALRAGQLSGAGLDVFDQEPLARDHPLRSLENVVLTPHLGYVTEAGFRRAFARMAEDVAAYLAGAPIRVVD
jgi:phosphoglycerate dehydrogenase-like enzyme